MKVNKILFRLYFSVPKRFRPIIRNYILNTEGGQMYSKTIRAIYAKMGIEIGYGTYGGCFSPRNIPKIDALNKAVNIRNS